MTHIVQSLMFFTLLLVSTSGFSQSDIVPAEFEKHIRFLASDALQGRATGTVGNDVAAAYIAEELRSYGVQTSDKLEGYYQPVSLAKIKPSNEGALTIKDQVYAFGDNLIFISGSIPMTDAKVVYAKHGWVEDGRDDYDGLDVKGKIVIVEPGKEVGEGPQQTFSYGRKKQAIAKEKGAIAIIEMYKMQFPWNVFKGFFGKEQIQIVDGSKEDIVYGWLKADFGKDFDKLLKKSRKGSIRAKGYSSTPVMSSNVIGIIEGSDPQLKDEYVLFSAHFDHVGMKKEGEGDLIFNGARDNAIGTASLLVTAKHLVYDQPKRSVIIAAVTGEEVGLLGSRYYSNNPVIPLEQTIFNLNSDGAGYNDTTSLSIIGYGRVGIDELLDQSATKQNLQIIANPMPEQGLYDRSDNVNFATKGVPAINISPGMTAFDAEVTKFYHQVADEADGLNFSYLGNYAQAYYNMAWAICNMDGRPAWTKGDKYEEAGKKLYIKD